jgi:hypothetical protein
MQPPCRDTGLPLFCLDHAKQPRVAALSRRGGRAVDCALPVQHGTGPPTTSDQSLASYQRALIARNDHQIRLLRTVSLVSASVVRG